MEGEEVHGTRGEKGTFYGSWRTGNMDEKGKGPYERGSMGVSSEGMKQVTQRV